MAIEDMFFASNSDSEESRQGLSIATGIVKNNWDSKHPGMVQVELLMGETGKTVTSWVRVMQTYAGNGFGTYFIPEVDTEVVIGFVMGDMASPIVLGSLWNEVDKVPEGKPNEKNAIKSIRTKAGHEILLDETEGKEKIEIKTKGELDVVLDDKEKSITVKGKSGDNQILINEEKGTITFSAKEKLIFSAGGNPILTLDGSSKKAELTTNEISIEGKQNLKLKGQNTKAEGNMIEIKGQGTIKVESSSMLQLKGSMTKIN